MRGKPGLGLIKGNEALDLQALKDRDIGLTGREPTESEIEESRATLDHAKAEDAAKAKP